MSENVDPRLEEIARGLTRDLAKLGLQFQFIGTPRSVVVLLVSSIPN